jgi:AICAR transformylase/IMP cyclohydrolase PurH
MRKLRNYWKIWRKNIRVVIFGDDTLDLEEFKLPYSKNEKLRVVVIQLIQAHQTRINLQNVGLLKWMQNANKRNLTISKLKVIIQNHARQQELKKHAITSFKLYSRCQLEFTDIL